MQPCACFPPFSQSALMSGTLGTVIVGERSRLSLQSDQRETGEQGDATARRDGKSSAMLLTGAMDKCLRVGTIHVVATRAWAVRKERRERREGREGEGAS